MTKLHTLLGNGWSKIYSKVPTGYLQVTHHRKISNLDPQGSVATGELDLQVALPAGIPTGIPAGIPTGIPAGIPTGIPAGYLCGPAPVSSPNLLLMTATTDIEQQLQQALCEANDHDMCRKDTVAGLQSAAVLQGKYS